MPFAEFIRDTCHYVAVKVEAYAQGHALHHNLQTRKPGFAQVASLGWTTSRMKKDAVFPESSARSPASSKGRKSVGQYLRHISSRFRSVIAAQPQYMGHQAIDHADAPKEHKEEEDEEEEEEEEEEEDDDDDDDHDSDEDDLMYFRPVLKSLDLDKLAQVATIVRLYQEHGESAIHSSLDEFLKMTCKISHKPLGGLENLVFSITFSDGVIWIARIPGHGTEDRFNHLDTEKMESEYQTMRYIRAHTTIPIPEVFYWNTSVRLIGAPFALMAFVEGKPLGTSWMLEYSDQQRLDMLSVIAGCMAQLRNFSFGKIGRLDLEADGEVNGVRGETLLYSWMFRPWETTVQHPAHDKLMEALWHKFHEMEAQETDTRSKAEWAILRILLSSVPDNLTQETRFMLSPPDFKFWDIFVNDEGQITGFIDWDGVHTEASCTGIARFPAWICSDYDPASYAYDEEAPLEGQSKYWSSPGDLSRYRQHYAKAIASCMADREDYNPRMTTVSHLVDCLKKAVTDSMNRSPCICKLLEHAFNRQCPFELHQYLDDYVAGDCTRKDAMIRKAAEKMWHPEWEEAEEDESTVPEMYERNDEASSTTTLRRMKTPGRFTVPGGWRHS